MSLAPRSFALLGKTHASPAVTLWYRGAARGANTVALEVDAWVKKAEEEILDKKVGDGTLHVVVLMLLAVPIKRPTIVGRSVVMI